MTPSIPPQIATEVPSRQAYGGLNNLLRMLLAGGLGFGVALILIDASFSFNVLNTPAIVDAAVRCLIYLGLAIVFFKLVGVDAYLKESAPARLATPRASDVYGRRAYYRPDSRRFDRPDSKKADAQPTALGESPPSE